MSTFTAAICRPDDVFLECVEVHRLFDGSIYFDAPRAVFEAGDRIIILPEVETSFPVLVKSQSDTSDPRLTRVTCVQPQ